MSIILTPAGHKCLQEELDKLEEKKRPALVERISDARAQGDLSENSDYQNARQELEFVDNRIDELKSILNQASVIRKPPTTKVGLCHQVTVKIGSSQKIFEIVSEFEADPTKGKISPESPIGKALVGQKKGTKIKVTTPAGTTAYTILKIE
jgi:transcription elongation factor GreA